MPYIKSLKKMLFLLSTSSTVIVIIYIYIYIYIKIKYFEKIINFFYIFSVDDDFYFCRRRVVDVVDISSNFDCFFFSVDDGLLSVDDGLLSVDNTFFECRQHFFTFSYK